MIVVEERENLVGYVNRVIVAGSRSYTNYEQFTLLLDEYLRDEVRGTTCFISGDASRGADSMIIAWCEKRRKPCVRVPAKWNEIGVRAGFYRNREMAEMATHLVCFYDGKSSGSRNMIWEAKRNKLTLKVFLFDPEQQPDENGQSHKKHLHRSRRFTGFSFRDLDLDQP